MIFKFMIKYEDIIRVDAEDEREALKLLDDEIKSAIENRDKVKIDFFEGVKHKNNHGVRCITLDKKYDSIKEASLETGISAPNISACCSGRSSYAGIKYGLRLKWEYI